MLGRDGLLRLLSEIRDRPRMFLPSDHYVAVVSWIEGLDRATEGQLLDGFNAWLGTPSVAWWGQIELRAVPESRDSPESDMYERLSAEDSQRCLEALFEGLDEFLRRPLP